MDGFIDWATALVDEVLKKSRMTQLQPIAAVLDSETKLQNFLAGRPRTQYQDGNTAQLQTQLNGLADIQVAVVRQRDQLQTDLRTTKDSLSSLTLKFWIVSCAVLAQWGIIGFLATQLFSRLH